VPEGFSDAGSGHGYSQQYIDSQEEQIPANEALSRLVLALETVADVMDTADQAAAGIQDAEKLTFGSFLRAYRQVAREKDEDGNGDD